jgi:ech hydrogenase subunit E
MRKTIDIPLGSQHISLLEPVKFKFECENEIIKEVYDDVGFVHRGIEKACSSKFQYNQVPYVVARICGLCSITHSLASTMAIEDLIEVQVSKKTQYLRILLVELDRIHSHLLCLAHVSENAGHTALFMKIMSYREPLMQLLEYITGNRVQFDFITIGGVTRDVDKHTIFKVLETLNQIKQNTKELLEIFETNFTLSLRFKNIGVTTQEDVYKYNAIGPIARAANINEDLRQYSTLPYDEIGFQVQLMSDGDIYSRNILRIKEIFNSIQMCQNIVDNLPSGDIQVKAKGKPNGETIILLEAPRGELMYYVKGDATNVLNRIRIKTPTFSSIPIISQTFKGSRYSDAPAILASFDPCMSCTAK